MSSPVRISVFSSRTQGVKERFYPFCFLFPMISIKTVDLTLSFFISFCIICHVIGAGTLQCFRTCIAMSIPEMKIEKMYLSERMVQYMVRCQSYSVTLLAFPCYSQQFRCAMNKKSLYRNYLFGRIFIFSRELWTNTSSI